MIDFKKDTIARIRIITDELDDFTDEQIADAYSKWSEQRTFKGGWVANGEKVFVRHALIRPIDGWSN